MSSIDTLARIIGYLAMAYGVMWLIQTWLADRAERQRHIALDKLRVDDPEAYDRHIAWQTNLERKRMGLPTDPRLDAEGEALAEQLRREGLL